FFQAEDGIRDYKVTGVQTCALPIYPLPLTARSKLFLSDHNPRAGLFIRSKIGGHRKAAGPNESFTTRQHRPAVPLPSADVLCVRSEERRVGKECRSRRSPQTQTNK